jgi:hypothetical protein
VNRLHVNVGGIQQGVTGLFTEATDFLLGQPRVCSTARRGGRAGRVRSVA